MFDIGFSELMLIGVVALIVIGPERLPKVARTAGHLLGRLQRYVADVKSDIQREVQLDELKKLQSQAVDSARELESSLRGQLSSIEADVGQATAAAAALGAKPLSAESTVAGPALPAGHGDGAAPEPAALAHGDEGPGEQPRVPGQLELGLNSSRTKVVDKQP